MSSLFRGYEYINFFLKGDGGSMCCSTPCPKKIVPFFYFFSRCPLCGEWCKLHWLLLDTPSFDWNPRRSHGHKTFKMAPTKQQKAFCAMEYAKTTSVITVQRNFRRQFEVVPPDKNSINLLKPNDIYICRTATLISRRYILNIYSTNIHTEYFKHAA